MKIIILFCITLTCGFLGNVVSNDNPLPYEAIFNFGDSISDTGNAMKSFGSMPSNSPYGSTYFKHPAGRLSNGRLIIDFIAEAYGLPFLPALLNLTKDQDIKKGVNFAFAGSSALEYKFFTQHAVMPPSTSNSLSVQLGWFKGLKPSLCKSKEECDDYFKKSLFFVGEIGGNDILSHVLSNKPVTKIREIVPLMVEEIANTASALIEEGVAELAIPGNFPIGCNAAFLSIVDSKKKEDYDEYGCLIAYNALAEYFNEQLKNAIDTLRKNNPQAKIIYFDYYNDAKRLYQAPQQYGFTSDKNEVLKACCGSNAPYNVDVKKPCGTAGTTVCSDPSKQINWDGAHLTEAAYRMIAKGLVEGPFANPSLKTPPVKIA
ncbi:acetylajmaline esterase [Trifolium repens]|nr:GDSL esterase/lipase [Trifolium repens]WJX93404.1 acetylajmaline esterase [Trifolium repens]